MEIRVKIDFDFEYPAKNLKKINSEFIQQNLDNVVEQLKGNIKNFKGAPISDANKSVRMLRIGTSKGGIKPLVDTGKLLASIKKTKEGVSFKNYGLYQDEGYTIKQKHAFYAPHKRARFKKLFQVGGAKVPARKWIYYIPKQKDYDLYWEKLMKSIKTINREIARKTIAF